MEYNKKCLELLGYVNVTPTDKDFQIYENEQGHMIEANFTSYFISDWNWIMKVIEKILEVCTENNDLESYYSILNSIPNLNSTVDHINKFLTEK